jgi:hypothetical protein
VWVEADAARRMLGCQEQRVLGPADTHANAICTPSLSLQASNQRHCLLTCAAAVHVCDPAVKL